MKRSLKILNTILNMLYPPKCPFCNNIIESSEFYCKNCAINNPKDVKTTLVLSTNNKDKDVYCISPFRYKGQVKKSIKGFKFKGHKEYSRSFAKTMSESVSNYFSKIYFDIVTCVPLSTKRKFSRGYNQSELLAKEISFNLNIPFSKLLYKNKNNLEQHKLSRSQRKENVIGVYSPKNIHNIKDKTILLCDDIITTGSTLKECANVLYKNGAKKVCCVTISNAIPPWEVQKYKEK